MSYIERLSESERTWIRTGASRYVAQFEDKFTESERERVVENLVEFMAAAVIFEGMLSK